MTFTHVFDVNFFTGVNSLLILASLDHSFSYKVAVGVLCAGMVLLVLVFVIILCICVSRRKQLKPVGKLVL